MNAAGPSLEAGFLASQKRKLDEERARLEGELSHIARKDPHGDDYHAVVEQVSRAPDDNVVEEEQYEAARSVEQSLEVKLRGVRTALEHLAQGTYGRCVQCDELIDRQRLEALPSAATCRQHAG